jgi:hypothetical protein
MKAQACGTSTAPLPMRSLRGGLAVVLLMAGAYVPGGGESGKPRPGTKIELSRREERCSIKGTSFDRAIDHLRHGPDMGTILCNSS